MIKKFIKRKHKAFTLFEVILYIGLVSVIFVSISTFFPVLLQARQKGETIAEVEGEAVQVLQIITQTIRNATSITAPVAGASASSLTLTVANGALSPTIFDLSGGYVRIKEGAGAYQNLTSNKVNVSALTFKNLSGAGTNGSIRITLTLNRINPSNIAELNYNQTFYATATIR